ncbi:TIR-like protein FxsC [Actinacidiphila sp. DG2A-62]|uniref:TIR-like protein FxsC n=1 Tax=Actinacidiphila sp. DG2A-62 TaxID=3108821 RepID=UPI002DBF8F56|nr:TIR-like protein FxsC [Actinacidiphila sp. DG2A-62]MEC3997753.1 TIR-like protein FxsC [Actinacidiphila sp. DG2A-62]
MLVSGQGRGDDRAPYFFLSYAHTPRPDSNVQDPDMWVGRLYQDLCDHVLALTNIGPGAPVGFMDRDIRSGEGWSERLAESLATCRVFVPLFSPRYFDSVHCGKEWFAFAQRALTDGARGNRVSEAIVPALWVPVPPNRLPSAAERLQFNHSALGDTYATEGLYGLIKLSMFRSAYELAVYELAKRIVKVAQSGGVGPGQPVNYRLIPSAFGDPRGPRSLRITVAAGVRGRLPEGRSADYYGDRAADWNPYHPVTSRPVAAFAADLARSFDYEPTVVSLDDEPPTELGAVDGFSDPGPGAAGVPDGSPRPGEPGGPTGPAGRAAGAGGGPEILIVDRWTAADPRWRARLAAFDAARPWTAVVVAWNRDDGQSRDAEDELAASLERTMPRGTGQGPPACRVAARGVHSLEALSDILPQVVEWSAAQYLKHAHAYPPDGPRTERFRLLGPEAPALSAAAHRGFPRAGAPDDTEDPR